MKNFVHTIGILVLFFGKFCAQLTPALNWQHLTKTLNPSGSEALNARPLQYNPELDLITFVHAASPFYQAAVPVPANTQSNVIVAQVSNNWGQSWDSTCVWTSSLYPGINPQAVVFNPPGNTQLSNAYLISSGATSAGSLVSGSWISAKQLGAGNYNAVAPTGTALTRVFPNVPPFANTGKMDFLQYDACQDNAGRVRLLGSVVNNANQNPIAARGACILTGSISNSAMVWRYDSIIPLAHTSFGNKKHISAVPHMAWNDNGMVGYVWFIGKRAGSTGVNGGYQPIVYKTTNAGATWSLYPAINFTQPTLTITLSGLQAVPNTTTVVPVFNEYEGLDGIVDMNDELHIMATLLSGASLHPDSAYKTQLFYNASDGETYRYPHTTGRKPYLFDFRTSGNGWKVYLVDSLQTEAPGQKLSSPGFTANVWQTNANGIKTAVNARLQMSKSDNGRLILFAWADSDINVTPGGVHWNTVPNVFVRMLDVCKDYLSKNTQVLTNYPAPVQDNAHLFCIAPKHRLSTILPSLGLLEVQLAMIVVHSENGINYTDTSNTYWFGSGSVKFSMPHLDPPFFTLSNCVLGLYNTTANDLAVKVYPNPVGNTLRVEWEGMDQPLLLLRDIAGKSIWGEPRAAEKEIDLSELPPGVYFLEFWNKNQLLTTKKILKQ